MVRVDDLSKNMLLDHTGDRAKSMLKHNDGEIKLANTQAGGLIGNLHELQKGRNVYNNFSIVPFAHGPTSPDASDIADTISPLLRPIQKLASNFKIHEFH